MTDKIISTVSDAYGIDKQMLFGRSRKQPIAEARQVCMYLLRKQGLTFTSIADIFGRKHPDVISNVRVIDFCASHDAVLREKLKRIEEKICQAD